MLRHSLFKVSRTRFSTTILKRYNSTLNPTEKLSYENRVKIVKENESLHYPSITNVRKEESNSSLLRVHKFHETYDYLKNEQKEAITHLVEGKITKIRKSGKKLVFFDIIQDFQRLQIVYSINTIKEQESSFSQEDFLPSYDFLKIGDSVSINGYPFRTKSGELSLRAIKPMKLLSANLVPISRKQVIDQDHKFQNYKIYNMIMEPRRLSPIIIRSIIINSIRNFLLNKNGFIEVETPIISNTANGANATPFITHSEYLTNNKSLIDLNLRIAPELYLKKFIIGGFDKVFEIGKMFRNEGIDNTHNPEFTTCEFYQTYTNLNQLIEITEDLLLTILNDVKTKFPVYNQEDTDKILSKVDELSKTFETPKSQHQSIKSRYFNVFEFIPTIESQSGNQLPEDLSKPETLLEFFQLNNLSIPSVRSVPHLLDKLSSKYIEPLCVDPSIIIHHPVELSPLSKSSVKAYGSRKFEVSSRFELFIKHQEFINAYEEENSPFSQKKKFEAQLKFKDEDKEIAMVPDDNFVKALEYGMPPTGGWGCGIDRLSMLLSNSEKIDDVLSFGNIKDVIRY